MISFTQEEIFSVGIVACDAEGHLNEKSVLLQCRYIQYHVEQ